MKDKYDGAVLEDIDVGELFEDIKNEVNLTLLHLDMMKAITSSDCIIWKLHDAFQKIDEAFNILITISKNSTYTRLNNRFQEETKYIGKHD